MVVLTVFSGAPAVALPECDVPDPPPICEGGPPPKPKGVPIGALDEVTSTANGLRIRGWAADPDDPKALIEVRISVDVAGPRSVLADVERPDVGAAHPGFGSKHGFDLTLGLGTRRHTSVCAEAVNIGQGPARKGLGCGRDPLAISILDLNIAGLTEEFVNDNGQGTSHIDWRERYGRVAEWTRRTGTLPDIIALQEMTLMKRWVTIKPDPFDPDAYEFHALLINQINQWSGAHYRIAYASTGITNEGLNQLFQGRAVIYNSDRLRNTTSLLAPGPVIADSDNTTLNVQTRSSYPCRPFNNDQATCSLLDGDGRHWLEGHINSFDGKWTQGPSAATFELKTDPGKHILVINGHQHPGTLPSEQYVDPEDALGLRKLVATTWADLQPVQKLIPPIIAADFNGDPEQLPGFDTKVTEYVDFILMGNPASYPAVYAPETENEIFPTRTMKDHCGTISTLVSDHCLLFAQFFPIK
jgi:hypothetical protein